MLTIKTLVGFDRTTVEALQELKRADILVSDQCPACNRPAMHVHCHLSSTRWNIGFRDCEVIWCDYCHLIHVPSSSFRHHLECIFYPSVSPFSDPIVLAETNSPASHKKNKRVDIAFSSSPIILMNRDFVPTQPTLKLTARDRAICHMNMEEIEHNLDTAHLSATFKLPQGPRTLKIEVTQFCNLACTFCSNPLLKHRYRWVFDDFCHIWEMLPKISLQRVSFTGLGESMMNPDFWKMHHFVKKAGYETSLVSNGMLLHKHLGELIRSDLNYIAISIETTSPKTYEATRKKGSLEKVFDNVRQLREALQQSGSQTQIQILTVVFPNMIADARSVIEYCQDENLPFPYLYPAYGYVESEHSSHWPNHSTYGGAIVADLIAEFAPSKNSIRICREMKYLEMSNAWKKDYSVNYCREPMDTLLLRPNGVSAFCNEAIFETPDHIEADDDFAHAWTSLEAMRYRIGLYYRNPPERCKQCNGFSIPNQFAQGL